MAQRLKPRGKYSKLTSKQQAQIGKYASMHGNAAALRRFSKELDFDLKESSCSHVEVKVHGEVACSQGTTRRGRHQRDSTDAEEDG